MHPTACSFPDYVINTTSVTCVEQTKCGAGQKISHFDATVVGDCSTCPPGQYQTANDHRLQSCTAQQNCPAGQFASSLDLVSAAVCADCPAGQFTATDGLAESCTACATGQYQDQAGQTSCVAATVCAAGQRVLTPANATHNTVCTACAVDTYQDQTGQSTCKTQPTCPPGQGYSAPSLETERVCTPCSTGQSKAGDNRDACQACATGTFANDTGKTSCDTCAALCSLGQITTTACTATTNRVCQDCDGVTQWQDVSTESTCKTQTTCNAGQKISPPSASTERVCSDCPALSYQSATAHRIENCVDQPACGLGTRFVDSAVAERTCPDCDATTYQDTASHRDATCKDQITCNAGEKISPSSINAAQACSACDAGKYQDANAHRVESCTDHQDCSPGEFVSTPATASSDRACGACTAGTNFSTDNNAASCTAATNCLAGTFVLTDMTTTSDRVCDDCVAHTSYSTGVNVAICALATNCTAGKFVNIPATASSDRVCGDCDATSTFSSTVNAASCTGQTQCDAGEKIAGNNATTAGTCQACPSGQFQDAVDHRQAACKAYHQCWQETGMKLNAVPDATADVNCSVCPVGQFQDKTLSDVAPELTCKTCPHGFYQNETGQDFCEDQPTCGPGHRISDLNVVHVQAQCLACPVGTYQGPEETAHRHEQCTACGAGLYQDTTGQTSCKNHALCSVGQGATNTPNATVDRTCEPCVVNNTYSTQNNADECLAVSVCGPSQFEQSAPTSSSDRVCATHGTCTAGQYESAAPTATSNRVCTTVTVCSTASQFITAQSTSTSDRQCADLTVCNTTTHYETQAPSTTSDRVCTELSACNASQYEITAATPTSDRVCRALTVCDTNTQFQAQAPSATLDRVCLGLTVCNANNQFETVAPDATTNRECAALTTCQSGTQFETTAPTETSDRVCQALTTCVSGTQFETTAPTETSDRVCDALATCATDQYETVAPTDTSNRQCAALTTCLAGAVQSVAPTSTSDRQCQDCDLGRFHNATSDACQDCAAGQYQNVTGQTQCTACAANTTAAAPGAQQCDPCPGTTYSNAALDACVQDCEVSEFSAWTTCTHSCGGGTQTRLRSVQENATNGGNACPVLQQSRDCNEHDCPVDCVVSDWGANSTCSQSCGGGSKIRHRVITTAAASGGVACPALNETNPCNEQPCPVDCVVSVFSDWSPCTQSCGNGTQTRSRNVTTPPDHGGAACPALDQVRSCNEHPCPVDCVMSAWGAYSACTVTCANGTKTRSRSVATTTQHGGLPCGNLTEVGACDAGPCPVDCDVSAWGNWSACTESCDGGLQTRSRSITTQSQNNGTVCPNLQQTRDCNTQACPVDCQVSAWGQWGSCSVSCGDGGSETRSRSVVIAAAHGGAACPDFQETRSCNDGPCPVHCVVSSFSGFGTCSKSCGGGTQTRSRSVVTDAAHGGAACPSLTETQQCNDQACPVDCVVSDWGDWTTCTKSCGGGQESQSRSIVVTPTSGGAQCGTLSQTRSCNNQACPQDCVVSDWGAFSACTVTCGGGEKTRTRTVETATAHGGIACPPLQETQSCNAQPCPVDCVVSDWTDWTQCASRCCNTVLSLCPRHTRTRSVVTPVSSGGLACPQLQNNRRCASEPCNFHPTHPCGIPFGKATTQACAAASPHVAALARTVAHHRCCAQLVQCDDSSTHDAVRQNIQDSCAADRHAQLVNNPVEMSKEVRKLTKSLGLHGQTFYAANDNLVGWAPGSVRLDSSDKLMEAVVHMARHNEAANEKPQWHFVVCWDETPGNEVCEHAVSVSLGMDSPAYQVQENVRRRLSDGMTSPAANSSCAWNETSIRHTNGTHSCGKQLTVAHVVGDVETWARPKNNPNLTFTAKAAENLANLPPAVLAVYNGTLTLEDCKNQCHKPWRNNSNVECVGILWNITLESCITLKSTNKSDYEDGGAYGLWWRPGVAEFDKPATTTAPPATTTTTAPPPADDGGGGSGVVVGGAVGGTVAALAIAALCVRSHRKGNSGFGSVVTDEATYNDNRSPQLPNAGGGNTDDAGADALLRPTTTLLPNNFNW